MMGDVPAGVRTAKVDNSGGFLGIARRGHGNTDLGARRDNDVMNTTA